MLKKAFTLIELVIAMVIVGILTSTIVHYWPKPSQFLSNTVDNFLQDLRYVRTYSMTHSKPYRIRLISLAPLSYSMESLSGEVLPRPTEGGLITVFDEVIVSAGPFATEQMIVFNAKGQPCVDAALTPLDARADLIFSTDDQTLHIFVEPLSGFAFRGE